MKTLILYATKHGAARKIAEEIAKKMEGAAICNLKTDIIPPLADFDCVILGSSVYASMARKEAKAFAVENAEALQGKMVGLFISGIDDTRLESYLSMNFPEALVKSAKAKAFLGGVFDPKACGFVERFLMKHIAKTTDYIDIISDARIADFAEEMER